MSNLKAKEYKSFEAIKHLSEDGNEFWLASRLQVLGYEIWIDKNCLIGGEKTWLEIDQVIRNKAIKYILVYSRNICINKTSGNLKRNSLIKQP